MYPVKTNKVHITIFLVLIAIINGASQDLVSQQDDFKITKGRYYGSLTFSLSQRKAENEDQLLRQVLDQDRYNYRIVGNGGYAIRDNFTLGLSLGYGQSREDITYLDENNEELNSKRLQRGVSITPNMRNYIPLGQGKLQIFVQSQLGITFGESLQRVYSSDNVDKIEGDFIEFDVGVSPGVVLFFTRNWAFETRINVAGLSTRIEEEVINNDESNRRRIEETKVDLKLNLLELNLGVAFYF
jgi:hypothetical protein